jgi:putative spermidine/putrescine transport system substrate-binding protein
MVQSGSPTWDVVEVSDAQLQIGCNEGLLEPIDFSKVGGKDRFVPEAVHECGVGTNASSAIIAYNGDRFPTNPPTALKDFFDVARYPGPRALRKNPRFNMEMALLADGVPTTDVYKVLGTEEGVTRAFKKLDQIKPHIKVWFTQWAEAIQLLADGEVAMTMNGNGRVWAAAAKDKKNLKIIWDNQGAGYDFWSVVKGSKRGDLAMKFIAFASQDRTMTEFTKLFRYGPTLKSVVDRMPPEIARDMPNATANMTTAYRVSASFWAITTTTTPSASTRGSRNRDPADEDFVRFLGSTRPTTARTSSSRPELRCAGRVPHSPRPIRLGKTTTR